MAMFSDSDRARAEMLVELGYCNPFLPERIDYERHLLGDAFVTTDGAWHKHIENEETRPNIELLTQHAKTLADGARERLVHGGQPGEAERKLYEDTVFYYLFNKHTEPFFEYVSDSQSARVHTAIAGLYDAFCADAAHYLAVPGAAFAMEEANHVFACFFQLRRAWHHIFDNLIGGSSALARLRAAVWQSIFTCDVRRYRRALYRRMGDITTLVTGPSGTGKELVARAIGLSRYIPFDPQTRRFTTDFKQCFFPINLSALSPTLIESELFGHKKGSFTGAIADRAGFFELCPADGTVFLDEIGELDPAIQVKLLRVLETRVFQRIGEAAGQPFQGKVIAATNRDLEKEMREGRFREDLYYRLCSDIIVTPSLKDQLEGASGQLHNLLLFLSRRVAGLEEAEPLAHEVEDWLRTHIDPAYPWPGNVRELEQCVRNIMVRSAYQPFKAHAPKQREAFLAAVESGTLTADELVRKYCTLVYAQTGNYVQTAHRLQLDRRTIKDRIDPVFLQSLRGE
jgi:DNA-binding NtrC family response regulator